MTINIPTAEIPIITLLVGEDPVSWTGGVEYVPVDLEKMEDVENEEGELVVDLVGSIRGDTVAPIHWSYLRNIQLDQVDL